MVKNGTITGISPSPLGRDDNICFVKCPGQVLIRVVGSLRMKGRLARNYEDARARLPLISRVSHCNRVLEIFS